MVAQGRIRFLHRKVRGILSSWIRIPDMAVGQGTKLFDPDTSHFRIMRDFGFVCRPTASDIPGAPACIRFNTVWLRRFGKPAIGIFETTELSNQRHLHDGRYLGWRSWRRDRFSWCLQWWKHFRDPDVDMFSTSLCLGTGKQLPPQVSRRRNVSSHARLWV